MTDRATSDRVLPTAARLIASSVLIIVCAYIDRITADRITASESPKTASA